MKAAVCYQPGQPLRLEELELEPPQQREVQVRLGAAGVCHSDLHVLDGTLPAPLPAVLGHEGAGIVTAVGEGVHTVHPGDHVVLLWRSSCGQCAYCAGGQPALCPQAAQIRQTGRLLDGTSRFRRGTEEIRHFLGVSAFATEVVLPETGVVPVPADLPWPVAALLGCAVITGVGAVLHAGRVRPGDRVAIIGAGGVGLSAIQGSVLAGAAQVVAVDLQPHRLAAARRLGATQVVNASSGDVVAAVRELTNGGADCAIEAVGRPETMRQAFDMTRPGGTVVIVGMAAPQTTFPVPALELVRQDKTIRGSIYGSARPRSDIPRLIALYRAGRLDLAALLGQTYKLEEINEAFSALAAGQGLRSVVLFA
ncbi:MAG: Zn-dependent alcohol dehydrogenase [Deinococcus sp.]|nr:Zn-dependent alcohol dehydrogenase [Deinococcus sp.]